MKYLAIISLLFSLFTAVCCAEIVFEKTSQTVKAGVNDAQIFAYYKFQNKGKAPVTISKVHSVCPWCLTGGISGGARVAEGFLFKPGEKGVLKATFTMGTFTGTVEKEIHVYVIGDKEDAPSLKVNCKVVIPQLITLTPKSLAWKKSELGQTKRLLIEVKTEKPVIIFKPNCSSKQFTFQFLEVIKGRKYECFVTPKKDSKKQIAISYFKSDSKHVKYRRFRCYLKITE